jgi:nitrogen fixation NifU-like protein
MYSERLLDHFRNPRGAGELPAATAAAEASNPGCGDVLRLSARIEAGRFAAVGFQARGCTPTLAAGSAAAEWLQGKTLAEAAELSEQMMEDALGGLPHASRHAARLAVDAVRALLQAQRVA